MGNVYDPFNINNIVNEVLGLLKRPLTYTVHKEAKTCILHENVPINRYQVSIS